MKKTIYICLVLSVFSALPVMAEECDIKNDVESPNRVECAMETIEDGSFACFDVKSCRKDFAELHAKYIPVKVKIKRNHCVDRNTYRIAGIEPFICKEAKGEYLEAYKKVIIAKKSSIGANIFGICLDCIGTPAFIVLLYFIDRLCGRKKYQTDPRSKVSDGRWLKLDTFVKFFIGALASYGVATILLDTLKQIFAIHRANEVIGTAKYRQRLMDSVKSYIEVIDGRAYSMDTPETRYSVFFIKREDLQTFKDTTFELVKV